MSIEIGSKRLRTLLLAERKLEAFEADGVNDWEVMSKGHDGLPIMPWCQLCNRRKAPLGRSVAPCVANGYCDRDCEGYILVPHPSSYWSVDEPKLPGAV